MTKPPFSAGSRRDRTSARGSQKPSTAGKPQAATRKPDGQSRARPTPSADIARLWGLHAVSEALRSPRRKLLRLFATESAAERIAALATERGLVPDIVEGETIAAQVPKDAVHQGLLLEARHLPPIDLDDIPDEGVVLLLDQVTDPHNVGAILRTAAAFNVSALVITARHAPDISGTLAKAASGGLEHVPLAVVVNLARALEDLGRRGFFRVGLDSEGPACLEDTALPRPLALVLGAEGQGLRRLTRERCDILARLELPGAIKSLNVSNACAAALTILRLRPGSA